MGVFENYLKAHCTCLKNDGIVTRVQHGGRMLFFGICWYPLKCVSCPFYHLNGCSSSSDVCCLYLLFFIIVRFWHVDGHSFLIRWPSLCGGVWQRLYVGTLEKWSCIAQVKRNNGLDWLNIVKLVFNGLKHFTIWLSQFSLIKYLITECIQCESK